MQDTNIESKNTKQYNKKKRKILILLIIYFCVALTTVVVTFFVVKNEQPEQSGLNVNVVCKKIGTDSITLFDENHTFDLENPKEELTTDLNQSISRNEHFEYIYTIDNTTSDELKYVITLNCQDLDNFAVVLAGETETELTNNSPISGELKANEKTTIKVVIRIKDVISNAQINGNLVLNIAKE